MLLLLFHVGENLYAIDTEKVIEIIPMVLLRKIEPAPDYLAGVFNYRGSIVPVVDLCRLIRGEPCQVCYSTRVIMVNYSVSAEPTTNGNARTSQLGLVAERVTETLKVSNEQLKTAEQISSSPYLGKLFIDSKGMIQKVNWEHLVADAHQATLLIAGNGQANGAEHN